MNHKNKRSKLTRRLGLEKGVSLIIPALNEEKTIENVIERCSKQLVVCHLVVINDGSKDNTKTVLEKVKNNFEKRKKGYLLTVVNHPRNMGKGAAIKSGLKKVKGKYVMVQDADMEYFPEEIESLFRTAEKSDNGVVFGRRVYKNKGYFLAKLGNKYLNLMFNMIYGLGITDVYTCYKMIPRHIWQDLNLKSDGFEIDSELVAKLGNKGYNIIEVPISYAPRKYNEGKKIKWTDAVKATRTAVNVKLSKN